MKGGPGGGEECKRAAIEGRPVGRRSKPVLRGAEGREQGVNACDGHDL